MVCCCEERDTPGAVEMLVFSMLSEEVDDWLGIPATASASGSQLEVVRIVGGELTCRHFG